MLCGKSLLQPRMVHWQPAVRLSCVVAGLLLTLMLFRLALRRLRLDRFGTAAAVTTLAVGLGLSTVAVSLFESGVRHPLQVPNPERLVNISGAAHPRGTAVEDWFGRAPSLRGIASFRLGRGVARINGQDELMRVAEVSGGFFDVMGIRPTLGAFFGRQAGQGGGARVTVISHSVWRHRFGGESNVLGRFLDVGSVDFAVVAVAPPGFIFPAETDIWVPRPDAHGLVVDLDMTDVMDGSFPIPTGIVARLQDRAEIEQAEAQVSALQRDYERTLPWAGLVASTVRVRDLRDMVTAPSRATVIAFLAASATLLMAAAASFAQFALARALARRPELDLHRALGATRARLFRLLFVEHALLAAAGVIGAAGITGVLLHLLARLLPRSIPNAGQLAPGSQSLIVPFVLAGLIVVAVSALATLASWRDRVGVPGRMVDVSATPSSATRLADAFLVVQWATALALLPAALLLTRTAQHLERVHPGFEVERVLTAEVRLPSSAGPSAEGLQRWLGLTAIVEADHGVAHAALTDSLPLDSHRPGRQHVQSGSAEGFAVVRTVSDAYFETLSIPLVVGVGFSTSANTAEMTVVVSQATARMLRAPRGQVGWPIELEGARYTVTGIVGDSAEGEPSREPTPQVYRRLAAARQAPASMAMIVLGRRARSFPDLQAIVRALDASGSVTRVRAMRDVVAQVYRPSRLRALVVLILAWTATLVAGLGAYAAASQRVLLRSNELAIRAALGCSPAGVARHVVAAVARALALALPLGLVLAVALSGTLRSLLFGITPLDPWSAVAAAVTVVLSALLAVVSPVRRAWQNDIAIALRQER